MIIMFLMVCGFVGLLIDASRGYVMHGDLQNFVDDVALAAANELDGTDGAIERAQRIVDIEGLHRDWSTTAMVAERFQIRESIFLKGDPDAVNGHMIPSSVTALQTNRDDEASHVVIVAEMVEMPVTLLSLVNGGRGGNITIQTAAAAHLSDACSLTQPLFVMCAPTGVDFETMEAGTQIVLDENDDLRLDEGEYGIVTDIADDAVGTCAGYSGDAGIECLLAINNPAPDCHDGTVDIISDVDGDIDVGLAVNTRFSIFGDDLGAFAATAAVSGDVNDFTPSDYECNGQIIEASNTAQGLPRRGCLDNGRCGNIASPPPARAFRQYWQANYGEALPSTSSVTGGPINTAYLVYLEEIAQGKISAGTSARAHCQPTGAVAQQGRRTFEVGVIDCSALADGVSYADIPVDTVIDVFLTETVPAEKDVFTADFDGEYSFVDALGDTVTGSMSGGDVASSVAAPYSWDGSVTYDPYTDQGLSIYAIANGADAVNAPVLYDTQAQGGLDPDLTSTDKGNVLIIQQDPTVGPNDNRKGGALFFQFDEKREVSQIEFFDGEEEHNVLMLWSEPVITAADEAVIPTYEGDPAVLNENGRPQKDALQFIDRVNRDPVGNAPCVIPVPVIGDKAHRPLLITETEEYKTCVENGTLSAAGISTLAYVMDGSGAIDGITFDYPPSNYDDLTLEFFGVVGDDDSRIVQSPALTK